MKKRLIIILVILSLKTLFTAVTYTNSHFVRNSIVTENIIKINLVVEVGFSVLIDVTDNALTFNTNHYEFSND